MTQVKITPDGYYKLEGSSYSYRELKRLARMEGLALGEVVQVSTFNHASMRYVPCLIWTVG